MASFRPKDLNAENSRFEAIVYRGQPYRLDFVMLPATLVIVELVNPSGEPLADYKLHLSGEELFPSTNVLASKTTDADGQAEFGDVPLKTFWFSLGGRDEYRTEPIAFNEPEIVRYRLTYDDIAGTLMAKGD